MEPSYLELSNFHLHCCSLRVLSFPEKFKFTPRRHGEKEHNLVEHGCKAFADIHLFVGAAEVTHTLPEVVEEGAKLKEAIVNPTAKGFGKKAVSE